MYCIECGAALKSNAKFCSKCGNPVGGSKKSKSKQQSAGKAKSSGNRVRVPMPVLLIGGAIIVLLGAVLLLRNPQGGGSPAMSPQNQQLQSKMFAVAEQFPCPCGECNDNLAVCDCTAPNGAQEAKQFISQGLADGKTVEQMVTAVQLKYQVSPEGN
ncbi:MAG TPA: zinc-ribbon domain-containing protein [bacterium]|nr:zinc-ribbon domain-containing protein [bacterium]